MDTKGYLKLFNKLFKRNTEKQIQITPPSNSENNALYNDTQYEFDHYVYSFNNKVIECYNFIEEFELDTIGTNLNTYGVFKIVFGKNIGTISIYTTNDNEEMLKLILNFIKYFTLNLYKDMFYCNYINSYSEPNHFPVLNKLIANDNNKQIKDLAFEPIKFKNINNVDIILTIPLDKQQKKIEQLKNKFNDYINSYNYDKAPHYDKMADIFNQPSIISVVLDLYDVCIKSWLSPNATGKEVYDFILLHASKYNILTNLPVPNKSYTTDELSKLRNDIGHLSINGDIVRSVDSNHISKLLKISFEVLNQIP